METKSILINDKLVNVTLNDDGTVSANLSNEPSEIEMTAEHLIEVVKTGSAPPKSLKLPGQIKDLTTLSAWIVSKGFKRDSKEYYTLYSRLRENLDLPLEHHKDFKDLR